MLLKCRPREALGQDVGRLMISSNLEKLHFSRRLGCKFTDAIHSCINVTISVIHARNLDHLNTSIIVLRVGCCRTLLVAHHVYHVT